MSGAILIGMWTTPFLQGDGTKLAHPHCVYSFGQAIADTLVVVFKSGISVFSVSGKETPSGWSAAE